MNILYLYSELGPYNIPVLKCLVDNYNARVHVVCWDKNRLKPFEPPSVDGVTYYKRSEMSPVKISELTETIKPSVAYISGWMDKGYFPAARKLRLAGIPVVTGFDDQWLGTVRQWVGTVVFRTYYSRIFSHAWVAGPRQFEFARRLGFRNRHIVFDMLTGDVDLFERAMKPSAKRSSYPKSFLYVGNFRQVKGTDILLSAFQKFRRNGGDWGLVCVGNGDMGERLRSDPEVDVRGFTSQTELVALCNSAGAFVLPSRRDQWGVVVHEFAAAGLPLVLSENVGAKSHFLIEGFNGVSYPDNSVDALTDALFAVSKMPVDRLCDMGENSRSLSRRITPSIAAANLLSVIGKNSHQ